MIEAKIDREEIEKLRAFFDANQKELDKASNYALSSSIKWLKNQLVKRTAKESRIQQKPLTEKTSKGTSRIWTSTNKKEKTARLWFGVRRISLARLNPKQYGKIEKRRKRRKSTKSGVAAGLNHSIFREGAFLMPIKRKDGSSAIVPFQVMKRIGRERLPIEKQVFDYGETALNIERQLQGETTKILIDKLREKLAWQTAKS